jgi:hypothetical protein
MLSIDECRDYLKEYNLSDEEIERMRNNLQGIVESVLDSYIEGFKND